MKGIVLTGGAEARLLWPEVVGEYSGSADCKGYMMSNGQPLVLSEKDKKWLGIKDTFGA